jgi:hypothetical protein
MKKRAMIVGALLALVCGAEARAADFVTAPLLVRQNELVTCQGLNIGSASKVMDITVDLIDGASGSIFGPATCPTLQGGTCILAAVNATGVDRLIYCRVSPGKKRSVRATIQINGGAGATAQ